MSAPMPMVVGCAAAALTEAAGMNLSAAALRVLIILANHADAQTGLAWPGWRRIMAVTGLSRASVARAVAALRDAGLVSTRRPGRGTTRYVVGDAASPPESAGPQPGPALAEARSGGLSCETSEVSVVRPPTEPIREHTDSSARETRSSKATARPGVRDLEERRQSRPQRSPAGEVLLRGAAALVRAQQPELEGRERSAAISAVCSTLNERAATARDFAPLRPLYDAADRLEGGERLTFAEVLSVAQSVMRAT